MIVYSSIMNIFEEVTKLNFPLGSYVVVGSGHLIALGLKEGTDVDIVVIPEVFEKCCGNPVWKQMPWIYQEKIGHIYLTRGVVEVYLDVNSGDFNPSTEELIQRATVVEGIAFASLEDVLSFKKEYSKSNPKHLKDIKVIEEYLRRLHR